MPDTDPVLLALGRIEGKLDRLVEQVSGHDDDIDELRRNQNTIGQTVTSLRTTLRLVWGTIGFTLALVTALAAVWAAVHG